MADFSDSPKLNRYQQIMEHIFFWHYKDGDREVAFERVDMERAAQELGIELPKNLGEIPYTFRYRGMLPASIRSKAPEGEDWIIRPTGRSHYRFVATMVVNIAPNKMLAETDEIYIGIDRRGAHYIFPVQAKGGRDKLGIVQVEQDFALCANKFPSLICRPIAAQFIEDDFIALFEFEEGEQGIAVSSEKHYRLVPADSLSSSDLDTYRSRTL